ncbi:MAG: dUTP diphosphatase [Eubacteriales bacterium]|nr:dUTP diphosphatase [Eubacteriales bacterium]
MAAIKVVLGEGAFFPERAHPYDAGLDLRTPYSFTIYPGESRTIDTGVHIEIPKGYVGMIKTKSGLNVRDGITTEGVIDCGYTGSLRVKMRLDSESSMKSFSDGEKIAQLVIMPVNLDPLVQTDFLEKTERGEGGFGSTGK